MWTDGRYFLQAEQELSADWTLMKGEEPGVPTLEVRPRKVWGWMLELMEKFVDVFVFFFWQQWAAKNLKGEGCFAIDPYLTSVFAAR